MLYFRNVLLVILVTSTFFLATDFILTALKLDPFTLQKPKDAFIAGTRHDIYHHDLKPNVDNDIWFGNIQYPICTNEYGFKISCTQKDTPASKHYDVAFIGDSFTEAVGMTYEESFVGLYAKNNPSLRVANLGVSSYSPSIYYAKIAYLLQQGFTFKHIIVGIDISDIQDEAITYKLSPDDTKVLEKNIKTSLVPPPPPATVDKETAARNNIFEKYFKYIWFINLIVYEYFYPTQIHAEQFNTESNRSQWTHVKTSPYYGSEGIEGGINQAVASMGKLKKLLDARNIKMSVFVYPWPSQLIYAPRNHRGVTLWQEFCEKEQCANFIDVNATLYDKVEKNGLVETLVDNYILDDFHFNATGNALVYKVIQENFINK